jgi:hypothetical protein
MLGEPLLPSLVGEHDQTGQLLRPRRWSLDHDDVQHERASFDGDPPSADRATAESSAIDGAIAGLRHRNMLGDPLLGRTSFTGDATDAFGLPRRTRRDGAAVPSDPTDSDADGQPAPLPRRPSFDGPFEGGTDPMVPRGVVASTSTPVSSDGARRASTIDAEAGVPWSDAPMLPRREMTRSGAPSERAPDRSGELCALPRRTRSEGAVATSVLDPGAPAAGRGPAPGRDPLLHHASLDPDLIDALVLPGRLQRLRDLVGRDQELDEV